jgi:ATP-dependent DNA helicase RecG
VSGATGRLDLDELAWRESEQVEWKANVADEADVARTLSAFANDLANLGGGYVVCGVAEAKDAYGHPRLERVGLTAERLKEVRGKVLDLCQRNAAPPIAPLVEEIEAGEGRRILVFVQPSTPFAHSFRDRQGGTRHWVRIGPSTREARNGTLRDLLVRKGDLEPWDRRPCSSATVDDIDLLALRDAMQRLSLPVSGLSIPYFLSDERSLSAFVPPLCAREQLSGILRPRYFALLLFGRDTQRFIPGAYSFFSLYPGTDRSDRHAQRHELAGTLIDQARRLAPLLAAQAVTLFDKADPVAPNAVKYPVQALYEAMGNALAHRDYELPDPTRFTAFADRVEVVSPGPLPLGVDPDEFSRGTAGVKWRNQALAWFFNRLQIAQGEGQGIPTIFRSMREEGCPPPRLEASATRVVCILPAHPRHQAGHRIP